MGDSRRLLSERLEELLRAAGDSGWMSVMDANGEAEHETGRSIHTREDAAMFSAAVYQGELLQQSCYSSSYSLHKS